SGAADRLVGNPVPGDVALIRDGRGNPLAQGFVHPQANILFRLLTFHTDENIDTDFWRRRIGAAAALRRRIIPPDTTAYRLINAEGDGMPGLVVDVYGPVGVISVETAGMEQRRGLLIDLLRAELALTAIYERSEGGARRREGLAERSGACYGVPPASPLEIRENGLIFTVDIVGGQKTGFFLDQRDNRSLIAALSRGARVLNGFAYTGGFSVYACRGGAARVVSVDASAPACLMAERHLVLNGFSPQHHPVIREDMFRFLRETEERFDVVILDPPAFAKAAADVRAAARGYKDINLQALKLLTPGGLLVTFSCSNHISADLFTKIVVGAARDAGRTLRLLKHLGPGADHPTLPAHTEGRYLKGLLLGVG
ncbi:MAG: class I SAM-dependent rRNA methyltransferase, partial [Syntrophales bacterium]|nr:class I SAM-dependent rRNA methyltransferase [Syntrophales bacterium]